LTSDCDPADRPFLTGARTVEGFYCMRGGLDAAIARGLAYAPYADLIWCETSEPNMKEARRFADAIHAEFPDKLLAYNCSPSFNWKAKLSDSEIAEFQSELGKMGYKFQFVTLAGFHALNLSMFELAHEYARAGMSAYSKLQQSEFDLADRLGYAAVKHQRFVGTGYFDSVAAIISAGQTSMCALAGSTETEQFERKLTNGHARANGHPKWNGHLAANGHASNGNGKPHVASTPQERIPDFFSLPDEDDVALMPSGD